MHNNSTAEVRAVKKRSRLDVPLPWFRFYPSHWQGSRKVQRMTYAQRGLYMELLCECWARIDIPSGIASVCEMLNADAEQCAEIETCFEAVRKCFDITGSTMRNPFIEHVRCEIDAYRASRARPKHPESPEPERPF